METLEIFTLSAWNKKRQALGVRTLSTWRKNSKYLKLLREFDAEGGAATQFGRLDEDASAVVLLNNALGERKT